MAQRILGIDLGGHAVKAVLLESTYRGYTVLGHGGAAVPPASEGSTPLSRQLAALQGLLETRGWKVADAVVALPGSGLSSALVTLPFTDLRRIEQTIPFEVEEQIPFELSGIAWDWQILGTREGRSDLYVGVARREDVSALLAGLAPMAIDPRAVVLPAPAYAALLSDGITGPGSAPEPGEVAAAEVVIDLGQDRTSVCVAVQGTCEQARTFAFGAAPLARALSRELGCSEAQAHAILTAEARHQAVDPALQALASDPRAAEALRRALSGLVRELRSTLRSWRARVGPRRVSRVLLAGELGRLPGLPELLAPEVEGGAVQPLALLGPAAQEIPAEDAPAYALALALALRGHQGARAGRLNLRRGDLAYTRDFEHVKGRVARLALAAALLVVLAIASAGVKVFALSRQERLLDRALCDAEQKLIGKCYANFEEAQSVLRGRGSGGAALPKATAVDLLGELSERVPADVKVRFEKMDVTRDKLHLEGATDSAESVDKLVTGLKASRCFADARSGSARRRPDGKFEFSIDSGLTCLDNGGAREPAGGKG
jgi:general secretion pathway protein L